MQLLLNYCKLLWYQLEKDIYSRCFRLIFFEIIITISKYVCILHHFILAWSKIYFWILVYALFITLERTGALTVIEGLLILTVGSSQSLNYCYLENIQWRLAETERCKEHPLNSSVSWQNHLKLCFTNKCS